MRCIVLAAVTAAALTCSAVAEASGWMFNPSYYTHDPVSHVRIGPRAKGGPYYTRAQGEYIRTGYRNLHSTITVGGRSYDHLNILESWVQFGAQY